MDTLKFNYLSLDYLFNHNTKFLLQELENNLRIKNVLDQQIKGIQNELGSRLKV